MFHLRRNLRLYSTTINAATTTTTTAAAATITPSINNNNTNSTANFGKYKQVSTILQQKELHSRQLNHLQLHSAPFVTPNEYHNRRKRLVETMAEKSVAIVPGYGLRYMTNAGIFYPFHQCTDMLYLCGFNEKDACLALEKDSTLPKGYRFTLFVHPSDSHSELWDGKKAGLDGAVSAFGADEAKPIDIFPSYIANLIKSKATLYADFSTDSIQDLNSISFSKSHSASKQEKDLSVTKYVLDMFTPKKKKYSSKFKVGDRIQQLRLLKSETEIEILKASGEISAQSFKDVMKMTCPGVSEHYLWACIDFHVRRRGADCLAYQPVVAGGANGLVIHYVGGKDIIPDGQLVLMDAGGEYKGYVSDITRTWPVNGKFTKPQRDIYEAVLKANKACIELCSEKSRLSLDSIHFESTAILQIELERIFNRRVDMREVNRLYPHHISHYMGMDVHEGGNSISRSIRLKSGMVVTIEPGLYIPKSSQYPQEYQGIGVRIEDDVVVTKEHPIVLTASAPKEVSEIESLMQECKENSTQ